MAETGRMSSARLWEMRENEDERRDAENMARQEKVDE
jgi:hypothetical protein